MGCGFLSHIGTFMLLAASIFLLVTTISAPVINNIGILTVDLGENGQGKEVAFGTFGWCIEDYKDGGDKCSNVTVGYNPALEMNNIDGTDFASYSELTTKALTRVMVLHPVATGLNFIAFLLSAFSGMIGALLATVFSGLAFLLTMVVLLCDFVLFGIVRSEVNDQDRGSRAYFSVGMWTVLVSAICSLLGTIIVFFTCCASRSKRRRETRKMEPATMSPTVTSEKPKPKWQFWNKRA